MADRFDRTEIKTTIPDVDLGYDYPTRVRMVPDKDEHKKIVKFVMDRARESAAAMTSRVDSWRTLDQALVSYIPADVDQFEDLRDRRGEIKIVVPSLLSVLDTLVAYAVAAFLEEEPIFRYDAVGPEDVVAAKMLEHIIQQQCIYNKVPLALITQFRNSFAYGIGPNAVSWGTIWGNKLEYDPLGGKRLVRDVLHEGNVVDAIDPYDYLPDPNVPAHRVADGEFVGWIERTNYRSIQLAEDRNNGYFNVKYFEESAGTCSALGERYFPGTDMDTIPVADDTSHPIDVINMYAYLVPSKFGLASGEDIELWFLSVAAGEVLIRAERVDTLYNHFPVTCMAPDTDGYAVSPLSKLESLMSLQDSLNWFLSARMTSVKKSINDKLLIDPFMVNMNDLMDPTNDGGIIRLRKPAFGKGLESAIKQLNTVDVTQSHVQDVGYLMDLVHRASGASDAMQGVFQKRGERVSASEASSVISGALSRMHAVIKRMTYQSMMDTSRIMAMNTQLYMSQDTVVKLSSGVYAELRGMYPWLPEVVSVSPSDINIPFDVQPKDGTIPTADNAAVWVQLLQTVTSIPTLLPRFNVEAMVKHIAHKLGAKNVGDFVMPNVNLQVQPTEQVMNEVDKGNLVPLGG